MKRKHLTLLVSSILLTSAIRAQESSELKAVVVEEENPKMEAFKEAKAKTIIDADEIQATQPIIILESVEALAGVSVKNSQRPLSGNVSIRGFTNERINISVDDMEIKQFADGVSSISEISALTVEPSLVKSVAVSKGGEGVDFGSGAIGGAIAVKTKTAKDFLRDGKTSGATVNTAFDSANHGGKLGLTAYGLWNDVDALGHITQARYGNIDTGEKKEVKNTSLLTDGRLNIGWEAGDISVRSTTAYNYAKVEEMPFRNRATYSGQPFEEKERARRFQQGFNIKLNSGDWLNLNSNVSYQVLKQDTTQRGALILRGRTYRFNSDDTFKDTVFSFDVDNTIFHQIGGNKAELTAKLNFDHTGFTQNQYDYDDAEGGTYYGKSKGTNIALSLKEKVDFGEKVSTDFGARYDRYNRSSSQYSAFGKNKDGQLSLNAGISFFPTKSLMLYGRYNEGYRAPNLRELYKKDTWRCHWPRKICFNTPQPNLKPETSRNLEVGFGFNFNNVSFADQLTLKASLYRNDIKNYIATAPFMYKIVDGKRVFAPPKEATHRDYSTKNIGKMKTHGAELEASFRKGRFDGDLAYSMIRMDALNSPNFYLGKIENKRQPYVDAPQDSLRLTIGFRPIDELRLAATATHRFKQKRLPKLYLDNNYGEDSSTTLDLSAQYKPKIWGDTTINFIINNVTDKAYRIYPDSDGKEQPGRTYRLGIESHF